MLSITIIKYLTAIYNNKLQYNNNKINKKRDIEKTYVFYYLKYTTIKGIYKKVMRVSSIVI